MFRLRSLVPVVACLLCAVPAGAQISRDANENTAVGAHFGDNTQTLAFSGTAPASGALVIASVVRLATTDDFETPTATNITFNATSCVATRTGLRGERWWGIATGTVGNVTFTTTGSDASIDKLRIYSFTSTAGWPADPTDGCDGDETASDTAHDVGSTLTTTGGAGVVYECQAFLAIASTSFTLDASYTTLTGTANQEVAGTFITTAGTNDCNSTSGNAQASITILTAYKENSGAPATGHGRLSTLGVGE